MPVKLIKYSYFESDAKAIHSMKSQKELSEDNDARRAAIVTKQKAMVKICQKYVGTSKSRSRGQKL